MATRNVKLAQYRHRPTVVEAERSPVPQTIKTGQPFQKLFAKKGDWICHANGRTWVVEGSLFSQLYEMVSNDGV